MKRAVLSFLLLVVSAEGFAENVRFKQFGIPIPARADLDVRWNAATNAFPSKIWVYRLLPRKLSPQIISNLLALCSFAEKDGTAMGDSMEFKSSDGARRLLVSSSLGKIDYDIKDHFNPTNLAKALLSADEATSLTEEILPALGVSLADIDKKDDTSVPDFHVSDSQWVTSVKPVAITNTEWRGVGFRRAVDGFSFISIGTGGDGNIRFGDHGKIVRIDLSWRDMDRVKSYPTLTSDKIIQLLRSGKAVQGYTMANSPEIDWRSAKSVTVNKARPCYDAGDRLRPSDSLEPFACLDTFVDTGHGNTRVEIDCPIIDETK